MRNFNKQLFREVADDIEDRLEELMPTNSLIREAVKRIKEGKFTDDYENKNKKNLTDSQ